LRDLARRAWPAADIRLVCPNAHTLYSGMVPGWLAGRYQWDEIHIDTARLAERAGVAWIPGHIAAVDAGARRIRLDDGRELEYELLSLNLGSDIRRPKDAGGMSIRPLPAFRSYWQSWTLAVHRLPPNTTQRIAVVEGGGAAIEVLLALRAGLLRAAPQVCWQWHLISQSMEILPGWAEAARRCVLGVLKDRGVQLHLGRVAAHVTDHSLVDAQGLALPMDRVIWCSGAAAPHCLSGSGLVLDEAGFVRVDAQLRSLGHPQVFAAGDCAAHPSPLPKAGVYAVRQGPVLARNLRAALGQGSAGAYRPQSRALALLNTADGKAVGQWGPCSAQGAWLMALKDAIDRRFIRRHAAAAAAALHATQGDRHA
ncbi:MAG: FAD-dependent oxidoreductase, partial [Thiobacillaceae bacterium]